MGEALSSRDVVRLRDAMTKVGTARFFKSFKRLLQSRLRFDTLLLFRFDADTAPALLDSWLRPNVLPDDVLQSYLEGFYRLDPFFQTTDAPKTGLTTRLADIAPDRFFSSEYYLDYYRRTRICDEVGLLIPLGGGSIGHLSMSRLETTGPYKRRELSCLNHYSPVLLELLAMHARHRGESDTKAPAESAPRPIDEVIHQQVNETLGVSLTRREAEIAGFVLQGYSNGAAALLLKISKETAKVHRRNLYRKLDISSQAELFTLLKDLL